ncbi:MAG: hypothetical protein KAT56_04150 [Sedimentisphaerales bacterium]|nr:hypothetical protein [Sedimentisphaerales bacterium]
MAVHTRYLLTRIANVIHNKYFDADCAGYADLRKGVKLVVGCEKVGKV